MKIRAGFVSNSSSTAFIVTNTSKDRKTLRDFVAENPELIVEFREQYGYDPEDQSLTQEKLLGSAEAEDMAFDPGEAKYCVFGDEQGTLVGRVFDYILREGGRSKSFRWRFDEFLR